MAIAPEHQMIRRTAGYHDLRLDGISDLVNRARGASVLDIGCNRGLVGFEFANNGAALVHGCDIFYPGIEVARGLFADLRNCQSRFEAVDFRDGPRVMHNAFEDAYLKQYDIVLMLAVYHKLKRVMSSRDLSKLVLHFGKRTRTYFGWRGYDTEFADLDPLLSIAGLIRVQTSNLSLTLQTAAIWERRG